MEIWANCSKTGLSSAIVYDDAGLTFFSGPEVDSVCSLTGDPVALGPRKGLKSSRRRILALHPSAREGLVGEPGEVPTFFNFELRSSIARLAFSWLAAHALSARDFLGVLPEDGVHLLRRVRLQSNGEVSSEEEIPLPAPTQIEVGPLNWNRLETEKRKGAVKRLTQAPIHFVGPVIFQQNQYGVLALDHGTGIIVVLDPTGTHGVATFQVPLSTNDTVFGCLTADGLFLTVSLNENHSAVALFSLGGEKRFERTAGERGELITGIGVPVLLAPHRVGFAHSTNGATWCEFDLEQRANVGEWKIPGGSAFFDRVAPVGDGSFLLGSRATLVHVSLATPEGWQGTALERKNLPRKVRDPQNAISGPPQLQLKPKEDSWRVPVGGTQTLSFTLSNSGGEASGIEVELSGDALQQRRLLPTEGRIGSVVAPFEERKPGVFVISLPGSTVRAAVERGGKKTKVDPWHLEHLSCTLQGTEAGGGLLMLRVRTSAGGSAATGKTVSVTAA